MHTQERQFTRFLYFTTDLQRRPNRTDGFFFKTEPKLKVPRSRTMQAASPTLWLCQGPHTACVYSKVIIAKKI